MEFVKDNDLKSCVDSIEAIGNSKAQLHARGKRATARGERSRKDVRMHTPHARFRAN